jgi:hypothetical protein
MYITYSERAFIENYMATLITCFLPNFYVTSPSFVHLQNSLWNSFLVSIWQSIIVQSVHLVYGNT